MKMKEFGPGGDASLAPPLDPPVQFVKYTLGKKMKNIELKKIWSHCLFCYNGVSPKYFFTEFGDKKILVIERA